MTLQKLLLGTAAAVTLSLGALSGAANAEGSGNAGDREARIEKIFVEMDLDQDGQITREEIVTAAETRFTNADADGDGKLSQSEFTANLGKHGERAFTRLDADGDGFITQAELSDALADGRTMKWLQKADANGDGAITREELEAVKMGHRDGKTKGGETQSDGTTNDGTVQ